MLQLRHFLLLFLSLQLSFRGFLCCILDVFIVGGTSHCVNGVETLSLFFALLVFGAVFVDLILIIRSLSNCSCADADPRKGDV